MEYRLAEIISNVEISPNIYRMDIAERNEVKAGQFYMLKLNGKTLLPRPISVCNWDGEAVSFVYAVVGRGTEEYAKLKAGDEIYVTGALGNGFITNEYLGKVAIVSGGIGTAPFLQVSRELRCNFPNMKIDLYAGFRDEIYLKEELNDYCDEVNISTNTGKHGIKGFVTDLIDMDNYDTILCCGPEVMMKKVVEMAKEKNKRIYVSLEKHMACGVGACLVCTCKTKDGNKRTCKDGPVFDGNYIEM
ncbi:dihydroorotate dehydrogenase electron transfer subunit [Clostridium sp. 'White wine YQ']|uniref:dihydroorotate dehydrogenase electron transfer subunit n=1 Tax=Clostridium sp. 'White wine YQ' TaxID=3027474 RepID=UPI002366D56C|nr:dihydroorotate dehydrogenase electron transfer subunit [Clostridium sp. 'White wine YQ']MDD7793227.1 dihydroorotate dehydrogenase electron transfer subunit [Clostridium sp. 'White wine YQ']